MTITIKTNLLHLHVDTKNRSRHNLLEKDSKNLPHVSLQLHPLTLNLYHHHLQRLSPRITLQLKLHHRPMKKKSHHEGNHRDVALKPLYFSFIVSHIVIESLTLIKREENWPSIKKFLKGQSRLNINYFWRFKWIKWQKVQIYK